ncbi:hypothetical protein H8959_012407, partial [Pygathrix nigripes]
ASEKQSPFRQDHCFARKNEDISLPEAVDVIISEPMGYMLFNEWMLESYLHSKKWLKSNGMMFLTFSDIHLAPFSDEQLLQKPIF